MTFFSKKSRKEKDLKVSCDERRDWYPITMFSRNNVFGHDYFRAYQYISQVRMVIDKSAGCMTSAVPYIINKSGDEPQTKDATSLRKLFDTPNFIQSFSELYELNETYRLVYGWSAIYLLRAFDNAMPVAMYAIPPFMLNFQLNNNFLLFNQTNADNIVKSIKIAGTNAEIKFSDLIFFRDSIPDLSNPFISESKMKSIFEEYDLAAAISEAERTIVDRRGALGILTKDLNDQSAVGVFEDERKELQEHYKNTYGLRMSKDQIIMTNLALKWIQMSMPVRDLMLIELGEEAQKRIAGVYNVPYNLLPGGSDSTFSNQKEAIKHLYNSKAIPKSESDAKKFTGALMEKYGLRLKLDYSDLYLFQDDLKEKAAATNTAIAGLNAAFASGNISREEWRFNASRYIDIDPSKNV